MIGLVSLVPNDAQTRYTQKTPSGCTSKFFKKDTSAKRALVALIAEVTRRSTDVNEAITAAMANRNKLKVASSLIPLHYDFLRKTSIGPLADPRF
jgi:hypothetical protein